MLDKIDSPLHNLNFQAGLAEPNSQHVYLSTSDGGKVLLYDSSTMTAPLATQVFLEFSSKSINLLLFLNQNTIIIAGDAQSLVTFDKTNLSKINSLAYNSALCLFAIIDKSSFKASAVVDLVSNGGLRLNKIDFSPDLASQVSSLEISFTEPISNFVEVATVNYYLITRSNNLDILKITDYKVLETMFMTGPPQSRSLACCEQTLSKFTFSVPYTLSPNLLLGIYSANIDFCSAYSNLGVCSDCSIGYKLTNSSVGNRCVSEDEFPPKTGASGKYISNCTDPNCLMCKKNNLKCEDCPSVLLISLETFQCIQLDNFPEFGVDPSNSSLSNRCSSLFCKFE